MKDYQPPRLERKALVHGHCHHKSVMGMDDEKATAEEDRPRLRHAGATAAAAWPARSASRAAATTTSRWPAASACCCRRCAKQDNDTLIIANGFSCQQQIGQTTDRQALHLAQVLQMALREGPGGPHGRGAGDVGRKRRPRPSPSRALAQIGAAALVGVGVLGAGLLAWDLMRRAKR